MVSMMRMSRSCDEQDDGGAGVGAADADVVDAAVVAEGDRSGVVDAVVADAVGGGRRSVPGVALGSRWCRRRRGCVGRVSGGGGGGCRSSMKRVELGLELGEGVGGWLGGEPAFEGLVEAFDFAAGGRVVRSGVLLGDAEGGEGGLEAVAAAACRRRSGWCRRGRCR